MKTSYIIRLLLITGLLLQLSCIKDTSNFDYVKGNPVKLTFNVTDHLTAVIDEPLSIVPKREFQVAGKTIDDYDHEWYQDGKLISKDADLLYNGVKSGYVYLDYYMIDKESGLRFSTGPIGMTVVSPYETGWAILYEKDGESEIAHIRETATGYRDQVALYKSKNNGESLGSHPLRIKDYYVNGGRGVAVIQQGGQGSVELDGLNYEKKLVVNQSFVGGKPAGLNPVNAGFYETADLLVNDDGKMYGRLFQSNPIAFTVPWLNIPLEISNGMKIKQLWDVWSGNTFYTVMYDELNNRLLYASLKLVQNLAFGATLKIDSFPPPPFYLPTPPGYINPSLTLAGFEYIWGGTFRDDVLNANCVFMVREQATGEVYVQPFSFMNLLGIQTIHTPAMKQIFTGKQYLNASSKFVAVKKRNFLFFSGDADNKGLYYYDVSLGGATKLYHTLPASITALRQSEDGQQLAVGLADGTVVLYDISSQTLINGVPVELHRVSGLGRIADITVRGGTPL